MPPLRVYIYGLQDPRSNEVRYVGASVDPWRRRSEPAFPNLKISITTNFSP